MRETFWRLTLVAWLFGTAVIVVLTPGLSGRGLALPWSNLCTQASVAASYEGCLVPQSEASPKAYRPGWKPSAIDPRSRAEPHRVAAIIRANEKGLLVDPTRAVWRYPAEFLEAWSTVAALAIGWSALTWGTFWVGAWILSPSRQER